MKKLRTLSYSNRFNFPRVGSKKYIYLCGATNKVFKYIGGDVTDDMDLKTRFNTLYTEIDTLQELNK